MIKHGATMSTIKPSEIEITEEKVFIATDINETESEDCTMYEYNLTEYDKDEYIKVMNASIEDTQIALCEVYELLA